MPRSAGPAGLLCLLSMAAAGAGASDQAYPELAGDRLAQGRALWLENCEGCHAYGIAGAPVPMEPEAWRARLEQPRAVLYRHAIDGFFGPDDTMMPPRGGKDSLTDHEVEAAVDYMAALARYYIQRGENPQ